MFLREKRRLENDLKNAIEQSNFIEASQIKQRLNEIISNEQEPKYKKYRDELDYLVRVSKMKFVIDVDELNDYYSNEELTVRTQISNLFHRLQVKHINDIVAMEKEYILRYSKLSLTDPPEAADLIERGKESARQGRYLEADKLIKQSKQVSRESLDAHQNEISDTYLSLREGVLEHQRSEMLELTKTLNFWLDKLEKQKATDRIKLNKNYYKDISDSISSVKKRINKEEKVIKNRTNAMKQLISYAKLVMETAKLENGEIAE